MLKRLRGEVLEANLAIVKAGLVQFSFGNVSGISRDEGLVVIKPSGVPYERITPADMVITDLDGNVVDGTLRPSTDLPTHLAIYRAFDRVGSVVHTHSRFATSWAQARRPIPCYGTTHADCFRGEIPVTDPLTPEEIAADYESNTGAVIVRRFAGLDPLEMPAVLVANHGPFCWGTTPPGAAENAAVLEEVARMAWYTVLLDPDAAPTPQPLLDKHFLRKHGPGAYYGQR